MKKIFLLIFCLAISIGEIIAQFVPTQRLIIPALSNLLAEEGEFIDLPAYCVDIARKPPISYLDDNLKFLYFGGGNTILTLSINGIRKPPINLRKAIDLQYLDVRWNNW